MFEGASVVQASSINQCRTILCSVFNYAIRFEKYDKNPVSAVPQEREPPGRERFPEPEEIVEMIPVCEELKPLLVLAPITGMRKGEILAANGATSISIPGIPACTSGRRRTTSPSEFNCQTWPSPPSALSRVTAITNTSFRPSQTRASALGKTDPPMLSKSDPGILT